MDGSTDKTTEITGKYPSVISLYKPERRGKSASLNRAVAIAKNDILIFSDANTILNKEATLNIAKHYSNPKVGGVAGEKKVLSTAKKSANLGESEGLYWKYESFLKKSFRLLFSCRSCRRALFVKKRAF
ncbi:MAG: glycosyltransferase [Chitinophagaceae bacterium]|nr:glycosyltransferase [Chitinophagaceae bacterium]